MIAPNSRRTTEIHMKNRDVLLAKAALVSILLLVAGLSAQSQSPQSKSGQWRIAGQNLNNTWSQPAEHSISPANVKELKPKWVFTTGGDVSATPTVDGDAVYFPDWAGNLFAVKKDSGKLIWSHKISGYFPRRCLHWRLVQRRDSGSRPNVCVLQFSRQYRSPRGEDRCNAVENLRHAGQWRANRRI